MTLEQAIKKYNMKQETHDCFGFPYKKGYLHYHAEKENAKSTTIYHIDNEVSVDLDDGTEFYLTIQSISKVDFKSNGLPRITKSKIIRLDN